MADFLDRQDTLFHQVAHALDNFKKKGRKNYTPALIRQRMTSLKEIWSQCMQTHSSLLKQYSKEERDKEAYFKEGQLDKYEKIYQSTLDYMAEQLEILEPTFSRARAREAIDGITITADNFNIAWQALKTRYEHKRRLIEVYVAALCNLPLVSRESSTELHALRDKAEKAIKALKALNRTSEEMLSDILVYFVSQKLDSATRRAWRLKYETRGVDDEETAESLPTFDELSRFISSCANAIEELPFSTGSKPNRGSKIISATASTPASNVKCPLCQKGHFINKCTLFVNKSPSQHRDVVKQYKRCFNCLSDKHSVTECKSRYTCRACQQQHHSMLHFDSSAPQSNTVRVTSEQAQPPTEVSQVNAFTVASTTVQPASVLLATAKIKVSSNSGREQTVRALIDQGSEVTFITERLAQGLRAKRIRTSTTIFAVGGLKAGTCRHAVLIRIASRHGSGPKFTTQAFVMNSLTRYAPRCTTSDVEWKHLDQLILADDNPSGSEPIDVIIGADLYGSIILEGMRKGTAEQPIAQQSYFGWILSGPTSANKSDTLHINLAHCSLEHELRRFWESEELPLKPILSPDEIQCEQHFCSTHSRASDGRYIVRLPFKEGPPISIGESRSAAISMLRNLNRRLNSNPDLKREYSAFLSEYETLGHMTKVQDSASPKSQIVYIPHHPVIRASSSTTRVRVVFNASSKTTNGTTLNNHLLSGPKLQTNLFEVLLRWRIHKYVYTADIAKMYRQIWIDARDRDYQRILWNFNNSDSFQEYQLLTVTYGTASAPFLALRVMEQLVRDEGHAFPLAIPILQNNIYVDDILFGAEDAPLLKQTREQVCALLRKGGFDLRKWASNRTELLTEIPPEDHGLACHKVLQSDDKVSILGIIWQPALDAFQFKMLKPDSIPKTKRSILSMIAKLFDPLGWATPVTIAAKVFMQELWRLKLDWDDPITTPTLDKWEAIYKQLLKLDGLQLPRWIRLGSDTTHCELHGFADASTVTYAASVYIRVTSVSGDTHTTLLAGRSKVAPVKLISIPRLELCAAVLLARLLDVVRSSLGLLRVPFFWSFEPDCYCWTDSTVTLAWLNQDPSKWRTFVAHRVAAVQTQVPYAKWLHVSTDHNPADCASRGSQKTDLADHSLWWQGPAWLKLQPGEWPAPVTLQSNTGQEEAKPSTAYTAQTNEPWDLALRYSSWSKLVRVTAYIMRFIRRCRKEPISSDDLSVSLLAISADEFKGARCYWLRIIQAELFPNDLQRLRLNRSLQSKSPILALHPFLDNNGLIRVGGRLQNAPLSFDIKHPIILASHPVV